MKKYLLYIYMLCIIALGLAVIYLPEWVGLSTLAIGVLVCVVGYFGGVIMASIPIILISIASYVVTGNILETAFLLFGLALPGIIASIVLKKGFSLRGSIMATAIVFLLQMGISFVAVKQTINQYIDSMKQTVIEAQPEMLQRLKDMGYPNSQETISELMKAYNTVFDIFRMISPAFLIITTCIMAYIIIYFSSKLLRLHGEQLQNIMPFRNIRGTSRLALAFGIFVLISTFSNSATSGFLLNIVFLLAIYFMVCGLALTDFYLSKKFKSTPVRILLYISAIGITGGFSILMPLANPTLLLVVAGLADATFDIRKLKDGGATIEK